MATEESDPPNQPGWSRALREAPAAAPDLTARVQQRVRRARDLRRGGLASLAGLAVVALVWQVSPRGDAPSLAKTPELERRSHDSRESLAVPSPVAQLTILDEQQSAWLAGLESLTRDQ